jgi:glycosyltransferase involved in cell wall biosynthesis|tara:strand:+ start:1291 stop:1971 length:681 start_codon:yes stop_codon:yes gene_type:complete
MIRIFQRHCQFSSNSANKQRPEWFNREKIFDSFKDTFTDEINYTAFYDTLNGSEHFIFNKGVNIVETEGGSEAKSFNNLLKYVYKQDFKEDDIIYFVEDDYLHLNGWVNIMLEGFNQIGADYYTLYDHPDKYYLPMYQDLQSKIITTENTYWRTVPSTTCTFACKFGIFKKYFEDHLKFCSEGFTQDHQMFLHLWSIGSNLVSCMPAYSTHVEANMLSPFIEWENV